VQNDGANAADDVETVFAIILSIVKNFLRQRVTENRPRLVERDAAMIPRVRGRLGIVLFKGIVLHSYGLAVPMSSRQIVTLM